MAEVPFEQKIHIDAAPATAAGGLDAATAAMLAAGKGQDGLFGGGGGIATLLALGLIGGGGGGLFGNRNNAAEGMAIANTVGGADILAAVNASNLNTTAQLGNTSREILTGQTNGFRDLVDQTHGSQTALTAEISNLQQQGFQQAALNQIAVERNNTATQLGLCNVGHQISDSTKDIQLQMCKSDATIAAQIAECCCKNQMATANILTQMGLQHCDLKNTITTDGALTRALITANRIDDLQSQLNDAKSAVRDAGIITAINNQKKS